MIFLKYIEKIKALFTKGDENSNPYVKWHHIKHFDIYIIKKFLGTYVFSILLLLAIVVMFDINEKLDAVLTAPWKETVFDYFMNLSMA